MTITDARFAAEVRLARGRTDVFDSIECVAGYVAAAPEGTIDAVWVSDFNNPGTFVAADSATFWRLDGGVSSPMGKGLVATSGRQMPRGVPIKGDPETWHDVLSATGSDHTAPGNVAVQSASGPSQRVVVDPAGPIRTIADGIRSVAAGGEVVVRAGTYREPTVVIDRPVRIVGEGWPTIDGEGTHELVRVAADDVTIRGLRFTRVGASMTEDRAAVRVALRRGCVIEHNRFDDTFFGVYLEKASDCRITDNVFVGRARSGTESTSANAIHLWSARDVLIARNSIRAHRDGIYFEFVRAARVEDNRSEDNVRYGLHFMYSDSCDYVGNTFQRNGSGVAVMYTRVVRMANNRFLDNRGAAAYGLLLKEIGDPVLQGNLFARNTVGLMADGATRLVAEHNEFRDNGWAVRLMANVQDGRFAANDFAGNTFDVASNGGSGNAASFAGNWFDEYRGYDLDRDGFGDVPHRPVRLFSLLVARYEPALVLQHSAFVALLDGAERAIPSLTPATLADPHPSMHPVAADRTHAKTGTPSSSSRSRL